ncbi:MAG: YbhB/YbcL family Raf kinase inhibitor-like protein [Candidatus Omnitrophica bacterium]|nr:YbhB/YbcL family Raf kinase inhibitor-like protein [Candidatus Omnitrophota bacterium]
MRIFITLAFTLSQVFVLITSLAWAQLKISSPDFENNGDIPREFTCQGKDINPQLIIGNVPDTAKSLALIVDDPDAPIGTWVHWVVYDIPPETKNIDKSSVPGQEGINSFGRQSFGGPCPPDGKHRYFFKLYALDVYFGLIEQIPDKIALEKFMEGHVVDKAELIGLYQKE